MLSCLQSSCAGKTYVRVLHDIKTVLTHKWAVAELLADHLSSVVTMIKLLDSFAGYKRKLGDHAEWPNDNWLNPVQLEVAFSFKCLSSAVWCGKAGHTLLHPATNLGLAPLSCAGHAMVQFTKPMVWWFCCP